MDRMEKIVAEVAGSLPEGAAGAEGYVFDICCEVVDGMLYGEWVDGQLQQRAADYGEIVADALEYGLRDDAAIEYAMLELRRYREATGEDGEDDLARTLVVFLVEYAVKGAAA